MLVADKMEALRVTTIVFLVLVIAFSGLLCSIIHRHISNKPPVQTTVIDLIYKDCIVYIFMMTFLFSFIFICCQFSDDFTLPYPLAVVLTNIVLLVFECGCVSMIISSLLRLLTILKSSEEAGIQLLGEDDKAIVVVRIVSAFSSLCIVLVANFIFEAVPPSVNLLTEFQNLSATELFRKSLKNNFYFVILFLTAGFNLLTYLVRNIVASI
jgi:hypothetical protein